MLERAVMLSGTAGTGQTTVGEQIGDLLREQGEPHAVINIDWLSEKCPPPEDDRAIAVWVVHAVVDPLAMFTEVARVLQPAGRFVACPINRAAPDDPAGLAFESMAQKVEGISGQPDSSAATATRIVAWAATAGFRGAIRELPRQRWASTAEAEIRAILDRSWSALNPLTDEQFKEATAESLAILRTLPGGPITRRAVAEAVVLDLPVGDGEATPATDSS
jgi:hypothetical protein